MIGHKTGGTLDFGGSTFCQLGNNSQTNLSEFNSPDFKLLQGR